jgi:flagellin
MAVINTNVSASIASNALVKNERSLSKAMAQLSTGSRINNAGDDAAGLAISITMTSQIKGLEQAVRNSNEGISVAQTADGALSEATNMVQRMRELAVQASNGAISSTERGYLDTEFQALEAAIGKIATSTEYSGTAILGAGGFSYQITGAGGEVVATVAASSLAGLIGSLNGTLDGTVSTGTVLSAGSMITAADSALANLASQRATLGSAMNTLAFVADNQANELANTQASRSRVLDTDYAAATTELARTQIIQQAGTAMLAQANQLPQAVLALLQ